MATETRDNKDISGKVFTTELVRGESQKHPLKNTWILWYHDPEDSDWTLESYKKIYEFSTIEDFWRLYNNLPSIVNSMFFLMKKGHPPIWETPQNINGGAWLYKFPKKMADCFWGKFSMYIVGETLMEETSDIIGLSISPKVFNVTIRIWNCNSERCKDMTFNPEYPELTRGTPLYKQFRPNPKATDRPYQSHSVPQPGPRGFRPRNNNRNKRPPSRNRSRNVSSDKKQTK